MNKIVLLVALLVCGVCAKFQPTDDDWNAGSPKTVRESEESIPGERKKAQSYGGYVEESPAGARGGDGYVAGGDDWSGASRNYAQDGEVITGETEVYFERDKTYMERVSDSVSGVGFGIFLFVASTVLLFWNEGNYVWRKKTVQAARSSTRVIRNCNEVSADNADSLVLVCGSTRVGEGAEQLSDPEYDDIDAKGALKLKRVVEMWQWKETKKTETKKQRVGNGTRVTKTNKYTYDKVWSESLIDSSRFQAQGRNGRENPRDFKQGFPRSEKWEVDRVCVGAYTLSPYFKSSLNYESTPIKTRFLKYGGAPKPQGQERKIGDIRVRHYAVPPAAVTVLGVQTADGTLNKHLNPSTNRSVSEIRNGTLSLEDVLSSQEKSDGIVVIVCRVVGLVMMWFGLQLIWAPLPTLVDWVPILGPVVGFMTSAGTFIAAFVFSLLTISIAWLWYRPLVALTGIALCLGIMYNKELAAMFAK